jgi:hypothetical protein
LTKIGQKKRQREREGKRGNEPKAVKGVWRSFVAHLEG